MVVCMECQEYDDYEWSNRVSQTTRKLHVQTVQTCYWISRSVYQTVCCWSAPFWAKNTQRHWWSQFGQGTCCRESNISKESCRIVIAKILLFRNEGAPFISKRKKEKTTISRDSKCHYTLPNFVSPSPPLFKHKTAYWNKKAKKRHEWEWISL